ncbi:unnamed protein product [Protopolystoma xenopodis]|uniref:Uncharacterized protein n=1 Tax=Protopolystoma xenopodis TaxID=117903 RepID=A0A3S5A0P8_9PLAT|nr:unnamed protein product [Protopolystoma xenopodis]
MLSRRANLPPSLSDKPDSTGSLGKTNTDTRQSETKIEVAATNAGADIESATATMGVVQKSYLPAPCEALDLAVARMRQYEEAWAACLNQLQTMTYPMNGLPIELVQISFNEVPIEQQYQRVIEQLEIL